MKKMRERSKRWLSTLCRDASKSRKLRALLLQESGRFLLNGSPVHGHSAKSQWMIMFRRCCKAAELLPLSNIVRAKCSIISADLGPQNSRDQPIDMFLSPGNVKSD